MTQARGLALLPVAPTVASPARARTFDRAFGACTRTGTAVRSDTGRGADAVLPQVATVADVADRAQRRAGLGARTEAPGLRRSSAEPGPEIHRAKGEIDESPLPLRIFHVAAK